MADWIGADALDQEENSVSAGTVDVAGEMGDTQSVLPAVHAAVRALDEEEEDDVFYCEREVLLDDCVPAGARSTPEPCGGAALAPEELSFAWPAVRAVGSEGTKTEVINVGHDLCDWTSPKIRTLDDVTTAPVDLVPEGSAHQSPTEFQTRTVCPESETQPNIWVRTKEEPLLPLEQQPQGSALPYAATAACKKISHLNGGQEDLQEEQLGENLQDADEEENDPQSPGEAPLTGGRRKSPCHDTCSKYNTVSYRKIRKGNTKQKISAFESMMHT